MGYPKSGTTSPKGLNEDINLKTSFLNHTMILKAQPNRLPFKMDLSGYRSA
jgi:hypothetical protein